MRTAESASTGGRVLPPRSGVGIAPLDEYPAVVLAALACPASRRQDLLPLIEAHEPVFPALDRLAVSATRMMCVGKVAIKNVLLLGEETVELRETARIVRAVDRLGADSFLA